MNRREFLQTSTGVGTALGLANGAAAAGTGMFISLNNTLLNGKVQWPESARLAAKVGYGGTDISLAGAMKEGLDATKTLLTELKLKPSYANLPVNATRGDENAFKKGDGNARGSGEVRGGDGVQPDDGRDAASHRDA